MKEGLYKRYLLAVLLVISAFNYVDRLALGLVLQDIKIEFDLSDTELGFLSGVAFALFYSIMGIPIARWADRGNRVTIISVTTALWSATVALCAVAGSYLHLLLIRVGVAVGEAGCVPPAYSLIADYFTRAERPRAVALYLLGGPLSFVIGYFLAGWLNEIFGWRLTFLILGLPGIALSALAWFTLKEPRQGKTIGRRRGAFTTASVHRLEIAPMPAVQPSLKHVCLALWANATFRYLLLAFSLMSFFSYGILQWQPTFFVRTYDLKSGELGTWLAVIYGLGGFLGTYLGGEWASRRAANNERLQLRAIAGVYAGFAVVSAFIYGSPNHLLAFGLLAFCAVGGATANGPLLATIQTLVAPRMRAVSLATIYLFSNFIGMGLGPLATGALSDALRPRLGDESLRYALLLLCPGYLWGGWLVWRASKTVCRDIAAVEDSMGPMKPLNPEAHMDAIPSRSRG